VSKQPPDVDAWDSWHPRVAAERLAGLDAPWYVAAGWAVDLFRGGQTRAHEDLEIAVPADRFDLVAARFPDCDFYVPRAGNLHPLTAANADDSHQTWALSRSTGLWCVDVFREPYDGGRWVCRRDESIRLPYDEIIEHDPDGIPYLAPEYALLFKAKLARDKDVADLHGALPRLSPTRRQRLHELVARVHPGHPWLALISPDGLAAGGDGE
jgi:hypothetical protein